MCFENVQEFGNQMKKVFITGVAGFLGSHLAKKMLTKVRS